MGADSDTACEDDVSGDDARRSDDSVCEMAVVRDDVEPWPASPVVDWTSGLLVDAAASMADKVTGMDALLPTANDDSSCESDAVADGAEDEGARSCRVPVLSS